MRSGGIRIADIAKATGFSGATVSLALNNNPRLPPETIRKVQEEAGKLGYISPRKKREEFERANESRKFWCLLFPYCYEHYDYTELDLFLINTLEKIALERRASLQITRLDSNNRLPSQLRNTNFNALFIKSYDLPGKAQAPEIYRGNPVTIFGFSPPQGGIPAIAPDYSEVTKLIFDAVRRNECRNVILPNTDHAESVHINRQVKDLRKFAAENAVNLSIISGNDDIIIKKTLEIVKSTKERTAFISLRKSGREQEIAEKIINSAIPAKSEIDFFICEFDHRKQNNPHFNYIDLRGEDMIRAAVEMLSASYHPVSSSLLLSPRMIRASARNSFQENI